ncbi:TBC domain-containing protein kinase-like protein isoform X2 [Daktulosphaira vitifoliae]|nr:TBC domain-containing protein kinase-like protein isoform X2 [Daktulosphaira vitifoliae]
MTCNCVDAIVPSLFGVQTLFAARHTSESCGTNGLPLTPNSITILGRAQKLRTLSHPNLILHLDFIRQQHGRIIIVSQYFNRSLWTESSNCSLLLPLNKILSWIHEVLLALSNLNTNGIVHRFLTPQHILLDEEDNVKLFNYGIYYMTDYGKNISFPIGKLKYTAPEVLVLDYTKHKSGPKTDSWSVGIIMLELILGAQLWPTLKLSQVIRKVLSLTHCSDIVTRLAREMGRLSLYQSLPNELKDFLNKCLCIDVGKRMLPKELSTHSVFSLYGCSKTLRNKCYACKHPLRQMELSQIYYLWKLAGGDVEWALKKGGLLRNESSVLLLPRLITLEGTLYGSIRNQSSLMDLQVVELSLDLLANRLQHLKITDYYPSIDEIKERSDVTDTLPLVIREKDTEYQFHRIILFDRLLSVYPHKFDKLIVESKKDIPPYYRGEIWSCLLKVSGDTESEYLAIDKETAGVTDRQIEVDIPRCHQYNDLLSSPVAHKKLKRVLKAWLVSHPKYVYWQGLDSLCAPFVYLNFCEEHIAYACLTAFVKKYLNDVFLKDNSAVIREYLVKLSHLIAFHDPQLANHLDDKAFIPDLFAIPWFLTMFSHVFPLHKIFHLWDKLLLGDSSYPLFVGFSILNQLRNTLLNSGFNECILLFSDLPEVDIEKCVTESCKFHDSTPRSITFRKHELRLETREWDPCLTYEVLHNEFCPRISVYDLLELKKSNNKFLVVDTRTQNLFVERSLPGSVNIFVTEEDLKNEQFDLTPSPELSALVNNKGSVLVVVDSIRELEKMKKFSRFLVLKEYPKVCCLHGGIESLEQLNLFHLNVRQIMRLLLLRHGGSESTENSSIPSQTVFKNLGLDSQGTAVFAGVACGLCHVLHSPNSRPYYTKKQSISKESCSNDKIKIGSQYLNMLNSASIETIVDPKN